MEAEVPPESFVALPLPLGTRLGCFVQTWLLKIFFNVYTTFKRLQGRLHPSGKGPTYTKVYPVRPTITNRVFIPRSYRAGGKPLPLFIDIHGGGFVVGLPTADDNDNHILSQKHGFVVVSIGYRLAPIHTWPTAAEDVAALVRAVLDDDELPCDGSQVAVGGYSAGGNLALTAVQLDGLSARVHGIVAYYPVTDWTLSSKEKLRHRADDGKRDMLMYTEKLFGWAYVPAGTDRAHPLLSPTFARREDLPAKICLIGCEYDMLCHEAELMAESLARGGTGERSYSADRTCWEKDGIRWEKVLGHIHGFNQLQASGKEGARRAARAEEMHANVADWLKREVYV